MLETISEHACFGGTQGFYRHQSSVIGLPMQFAVYQPPQPEPHFEKGGQGGFAVPASPAIPVLFYLAGLTCNEETFMIKAGAQRFAAQHGIMLVAPDTSPRQTGIAGEADSWDFGSGAGFYLDATQAPWNAHYRMESYLVRELLPLIMQQFPARAGKVGKVGIFGHSMGGHGALTLALRHPGLFQSVSAFAPIVSAAHSPWGHKAFSGYLGGNEADWQDHDASELMRKQSTPYPQGILIDQGLADKFLPTQLMPERFEAACAVAQQPLTLRRHAGYDHGYYFIASFMEEHMAFHARCLAG